MDYIFITDKLGKRKPIPISRKNWDNNKRHYLVEGYREATDQEIEKYYDIVKEDHEQAPKEDKKTSKRRRRKKEEKKEEE